MKTKVLIFLFCLASLNVMGQGTITRNSTRKTQPQKSKTEQPAKQNSGKKQTVSQGQRGGHSSKPLSQPTGYVNGHGYVDLGLSVKWATCNIGASCPSDYGNYYAWGETTTKRTYELSNCFDYLHYNDNEDDPKNWNVYKKGGQSVLLPTSGHDTARENWGGSWRMPSEEEVKELLDNCKWTWAIKNEHKGYIVKGPNGNTIFLPCAGVWWIKDLHCIGQGGSYWTSVGSFNYYACSAEALNFSRRNGMDDFTGCNHDRLDDLRYIGRSVRPVTD